MTGFGTCFVLELRALAARRLTQVGAVLVFAVTLATAWAANTPESGTTTTVVNGWRCLALGMASGMTAAAVVAALLGSQAIAATAVDGSLRTTLCRPVGRGSVLLAHAAALAIVAVALVLLALLGGFLGGIPSGFGDAVIMLGDLRYPAPDGEAATLFRRALLVCLGAPLVAVTAAWCGLAVSVVTDHPGVTAGAALLGGAVLGRIALAHGVTDYRPHPWCDWVFLRPGLRVWAAFREVADGSATLAWERAPLGAAIGVPLVTMAVVLAFATWWFTRRDVLA